MELKPGKKIGAYRVYKLNKFKELNNNLLAQLHKEWPKGATHAVFEFGEPIKNEWSVTKPLRPEYNVALIYTARPAAIKVKKTPLPETLERRDLSLEKTRTLYRKILTKTHKKIKKLGPAFKTEIKTALAALSKARRELLFKNGRPVTLYAIYRRSNYIGKNSDWMLTGWGSPDLSKREALAVDEDFWAFVKKSKLPVDFKTRSFMRGAQRQARLRGFKPNYVTVARQEA